MHKDVHNVHRSTPSAKKNENVAVMIFERFWFISLKSRVRLVCTGIKMCPQWLGR